MQLLHAVCDPATSWYVLGGHSTHEPVLVDVQVLFKKRPTPHDSVQLLHTERPLGASLKVLAGQAWQVRSAMVVHALATN